MEPQRASETARDPKHTRARTTPIKALNSKCQNVKILYLKSKVFSVLKCSYHNAVKNVLTIADSLCAGLTYKGNNYRKLICANIDQHIRHKI